MLLLSFPLFFFFFFNDTATTEIYTLSLHDALPICPVPPPSPTPRPISIPVRSGTDRKSTRLNSSHTVISYAVFCLKKKKVKHVPSPDLFIARLERIPVHREDHLARVGELDRGVQQVDQDLPQAGFFAHAPTPEIYTLPLHDALPI